jgi:hypothetical protein
MRWPAWVAKAALLVLVLIDSLVVYERWRYGSIIVATNATSGGPGETIFKISKVPPSTQDWAAFGFLILAHVLVIWLILRFRRKLNPQH